MSLSSYLHEPSRIVRKVHWWAMRSRHTGEVTADTWNGRLTFHCSDGLIGKFLFVRRAYEQHYITRVIAYLDAAGLRTASRDVVLDVGANIGMIAIALVKHGWYRQAIAFEPEPYNFRLLRHNVLQNGLDGTIACREVALSSHCGEGDLVVCQGNSGAHFMQAAPEIGTTAVAAPVSLRVKTATCDEILAAEFGHLVDRVGLVWLDIEGHESHFFRGSSRLLAQGVPVVSEFYPQAIERAGFSPGEYRDLVARRFTHVCIDTDGHFVEQPIAAVERLFAHYPKDGTNVIYLRR